MTQSSRSKPIFKKDIDVDMDLEFFDRVSHDIRMARVARKVKDKRVLKLLRG